MKFQFLCIYVHRRENRIILCSDTDAIGTLKQSNVLKFIEFLWFDGKHCISDMLFIMHSVYGKRIANWIDTIIKTASKQQLIYAFFHSIGLFSMKETKGKKFPVAYQPLANISTDRDLFALIQIPRILKKVVAIY